jgi:extracellular factor (EF) 3-hydroxypalmitic acid methyl ester biosynthesis protein
MNVADCPPAERNGAHVEVIASEKLLDQVYDELAAARLDGETMHGEQVWQAMDRLCCGLQTQRERMKAQAWVEQVEACLRHPLRELVHQDPFTWRAFTKPKGYAGDAQLLDYIYGREEQWPVPSGTTPLGRALFDYTTASPACAGVRARREFIANLLDQLAEEVHRPTVLSVAAGHLREALLSAAVKRRKLGKYVALDVDADSLEEVKRCYGFYGVETCTASFRRLLTGKTNLEPFDLVYSTGLYDYLAQPVAQQLTAALFHLVRPRGRLLVANFLPGIRDVGYMETYMGWNLIYRTRRDMLDVAALIPEAQVRDLRLFSEENLNILFLQVTRR